MKEELDAIVAALCFSTFVLLVWLFVYISNRNEQQVDRPQQQQTHAYIAKLNCYCRRTTTDRGVYLINEHQDTVAFIYHPHKIIEWTQP
jgi:hypothetical protein